ncbi:MAG: hypothetical protein IAE93_04185 [Ignavibacteria bacterium]|nr:hypothetical protein [Ignavibacteria bacterium]
MKNKIKYEIPISGSITIKVVDIIGTPVRVILNKHESAGQFEVSLDSEALPAGKYYYKVLFTGNNEIQSKADGALNQGDTIASGQVKIEVQ